MAVRAAIYTWFRGAPPDDPEEDNAVQEERCRGYVESMGYQVQDVYREMTTEPTDDRPELKRLRSAIWSRRVDVVVAAHPNRVYVDIDRVARLIMEARELGIRFEFLEMPYILTE